MGGRRTMVNRIGIIAISDLISGHYLYSSELNCIDNSSLW